MSLIDMPSEGATLPANSAIVVAGRFGPISRVRLYQGSTIVYEENNPPGGGDPDWQISVPGQDAGDYVVKVSHGGKEANRGFSLE